MSRRQRIIEVIDTAIEGQKWLIDKWAGSYGKEYPDPDMPAQRISRISTDIDQMRELKAELKAGARI
jgi:hypothetical protein